MGLLKALGPGRIYLDANVFIYTLEGFPRYASLLLEVFRSIDGGEREAVTSELTLGEVLVRPIRERDREREQEYREWIRDEGFLRVTPVSRTILIGAAGYCAREALRLPDAIHVASATVEGCATLLTNDRRLGSLRGLRTVLISDYV